MATLPATFTIGQGYFLEAALYEVLAVQDASSALLAAYSGFPVASGAPSPAAAGGAASAAPEGREAAISGATSSSASHLSRAASQLSEALAGLTVACISAIVSSAMTSPAVFNTDSARERLFSPLAHRDSRVRLVALTLLTKLVLANLIKPGPYILSALVLVADEDTAVSRTAELLCRKLCTDMAPSPIKTHMVQALLALAQGQELSQARFCRVAEFLVRNACEDAYVPQIAEAADAWLSAQAPDAAGAQSSQRLFIILLLVFKAASSRGRSGQDDGEDAALAAHPQEPQLGAAPAEASGGPAAARHKALHSAIWKFASAAGEEVAASCAKASGVSLAKVPKGEPEPENRRATQSRARGAARQSRRATQPRRLPPRPGADQVVSAAEPADPELAEAAGAAVDSLLEASSDLEDLPRSGRGRARTARKVGGTDAHKATWRGREREGGLPPSRGSSRRGSRASSRASSPGGGDGGAGT